MSSMEDVTLWIHRLEEGDEKAASELWNRYFRKLVRIAQDRLGKFPAASVDGEDAALSAFKSFFEGMSEGQYANVNDRTDLWRLLVTITIRKTNNYRKKHFAQKRGGGKVYHASALESNEPGREGNILEQLLEDGASPEMAAIMSETCSNLMHRLEDESLVVIASKKLEGYSNAEIAEQLDCSERTIERKLSRIRRKWETEDGEESA